MFAPAVEVIFTTAGLTFWAAEMIADDSCREICWAELALPAGDVVSAVRLNPPAALRARNVPPEARIAEMSDTVSRRATGQPRLGAAGALATRVTGCSNQPSGVTGSGAPAATRP